MSFISPHELSAFPDALVAALNRQGERAPLHLRDSLNQQNSYQSLITEIASATEGSRNEIFNKNIFTVFRLSDDKRPSKEFIWEDVLEALSTNGYFQEEGEEVCRKIFESAFSAAASSHEQLNKLELSRLFKPRNIKSSTAHERRLTLIPASECGLEERTQYLVKGLFGYGDFVCAFGPPGSGKSVLAPYLAHAISNGSLAFGKKTRQSTVLYIAPEDPRGIGSRIKALIQRFGLTDNLFLVTGLTNFGAEDQKELVELAELIKRQQPALIIIDTLAMGWPGLDENSSEAMSKVVFLCKAITGSGPAVLLVHHNTKTGDSTPRGHSSLNGALDVAFQIMKADSSGVIDVKLTKNRNGSCDQQISFKIESEHIGVDEDGDSITAPVAVEVDAQSLPPRKKLSRSEQAALRVLDQLMPDEILGIPLAVTFEEWRKACIDGKQVSAAEKENSRKKAVSRAITGLLDKKIIIIDEDQVSIRQQGTVRDKP